METLVQLKLTAYTCEEGVQLQRRPELNWETTDDVLAAQQQQRHAVHLIVQCKLGT